MKILLLPALLMMLLASCGGGGDSTGTKNLDTANTLNDTFPARPHGDTIPKDGTYVDSALLTH
ncbi:MAG TPA: hypothetical protein VF145_12205 [Chitinophagaceae bacterium]